MSVNRLFLDWKDPFLDSTLEFFLNNSKSTAFIDVSDFYVLTTVSRVGRRLIERLSFVAEEKGLGLSPPQVLSISSAYNLLLAKYKLVTKTQSRLIFLNLLEAKGSDLEKLDTAKFLCDTYLELTKNGESAESSINKIIQAGLYADESRWTELLEIFKQYKNQLKFLNLIDSVDALEILSQSKSKISKPLVLLACFDLSPIISKTIQAGFENITSLIFAPEFLADGFSDLGKVEPAFWETRQLNLNSSNFKTLPNYDHEHKNIFCELDRLPKATSASKISIGACNENNAKVLALRSLEYKLPLHLVADNNLINSAQAQALICALKYVSSRSFADLAAFLTTPNLPESLSLGLDLINKYRAEALQPKTLDPLPGRSVEVQKFIQNNCLIFDPIKLESASAQQWLDAFKTFLNSLFAESETVLSSLDSLLSDLSSLEISKECVKALLLEALSLEVLPSASDQDEIDVVGWLELCLDDAPNCFVYGLNDGSIPAPIAANSLLPDTLRVFLGLDCFHERLARDKYILESLLNSKQNLSLSCSRFSEQGEALLPSRILLETSQTEKIANLEYFFSAQESSQNKLPKTSRSLFSQYLQKQLAPKDLPEAPQSVTVSALNDYLKCPYYFYLRHVLKLRQEDPDITELSAAQVGNILHSVLAGFGTSQIKDSENPEEIEKYLLFNFERQFRNNFGQNPFPEVMVQYYQLQERLKKFSLWQSHRRQLGWSIHSVELDFADPGFAIGPKLTCTGRIDRIDYNSDSKTYSIIDYKSGENFKTTPYTEKSGWQELQLAVYWLYSEEILNFRVSELGFLSLKLRGSDLNLSIFKPQVELMASASESIKQLGKSISNQIYWPPRLKSSLAFDFAPIYQSLEAESER